MAISGTGGFTLGFDYNQNDQLISIKEGSITLAQLNYDTQGDFSSVDYVNNTRLELTMDKQKGVVTGLLLKNSVNDTLNQITNVFNNKMLLSQETINSSVKDYQYSNIKELTQSGTTDGYRYQTNTDGNIARKENYVSDSLVSYKEFSYNNNNNQLSQIYEYTGGSLIKTTNYTYDANGNLATKSDGTDTYEYAYDLHDKLTQVKKNGVVILTNTYDAMGRRIRKVTQNRTINYIAGGLIETDDAGNVITAYKSICFTQGGVNYYPVHDNRGSVIKIVDGSGNVTASYTYDDYGMIIDNSNPSFDNRFFFCGCEYDAETGLYLMGARYYDPEVGRFITPDPIGAMGGLNLYAYCKNDPINFIDPSGLKLIVIISEADGDFDWLFGSHSLLIIDKEEEYGFITNNVLYDPSGSYNPGGRRPAGGDCLSAYDAQLKTYINYWKGNDTKGKIKFTVFSFDLPKDEEDALYTVVNERNAAGFAQCADSISSALKTINTFKKNINQTGIPKDLKNQLLKLQNKIKDMNVETIILNDE
jgi:RHS repeat-associated protein